jgi:adenine/guanine phosphoribosyltransferase-like PRPP-binding protein
MLEIIPKKRAKEAIRRLTEQQPLTIMVKEGEGSAYPYLMLNIEYRVNPEFLIAANSGLVHMKRDLLGDEVYNIIVPEAKGNWLAPLFVLSMQNEALASRKRRYNIPGEVCLSVETAYGKPTEMYVPGSEVGEELLILDDMISKRMTVKGHIEGMERADRKIVGALSLWERGNGVRELKREYEGTGKVFGGFARLEVEPGEGVVDELLNHYETNDFDKALNKFLLELEEEENQPGTKYMGLNGRFNARITRFYDGNEI